MHYSSLPADQYYSYHVDYVTDLAEFLTDCTATGLSTGQTAIGIKNTIPFTWKAEGQDYPEINVRSGASGVACGPGGLQLYVNVAECEGPVLEVL